MRSVLTNASDGVGSSVPEAISGESPRYRPSSDVTALAILVLLTLVVAWNRLNFDDWLGRFDLATFFLPWLSTMGERVRAFAVPGWNPHLFAGTPLAGDPESGWMYVPAMLAFGFLPVLSAMKTMVAGQLIVASLSTYAYARVLGMAPVAAMSAAVAFAFGPFLHWNTYCCLVFAGFATWIPLALLGVELALASPDWRRRISHWFVSGFAVSQMLAGWAGEGWFYACLLVGSYTMYRVVFPRVSSYRLARARLWTGVATAIASIGSGVALGAAGVLPRLSVNAQTHLAGGDYASMGAEGILNPAWTVEQLGLRLLGSGYGQRSTALGGAVIVLALLAPFVARRDSPIFFFSVLTLVAWTLTQETTPLHRLFYLVPQYQSLHEHDPWRTMALSSIGPAVLCGATVDRINTWRGRLTFLPVTLAPLLVIIVVATILSRSGHDVGRAVLASAGFATLIVAGVVVARGPIRHTSTMGRVATIAPVLLLALVVMQPVGLEVSGSWLGWPRDASWAPHWDASPKAEVALGVETSEEPSDGAAAFLQERIKVSEPFRYAGYGGIGFPGDSASRGSYMGSRFDPNTQALLTNGRPIFLGLYDIQGYNPLQLARYAEFFDALNGRSLDYHVAYLLPSGTASPMLDLLDVQYIIVDRRLPEDRADLVALRARRSEVYRDDRVVIYERTEDLPHAWIVYDVRRVGRSEALEPLATGQFDPYRTALVEGPVNLAGGDRPANAASARVTTYEADSMTVEIATDSAGLLVVSEVYAEGWNAYIAGQQLHVLPTDHALRGVAVPAGEHVVEFRYEPDTLRFGMAISAATGTLMVVTFAVNAWSWSGSRRKRAG